MRNRTRVRVVMLMTAVLLLSACAATDTRRSVGEVVDDSGIATRVKSALVADPLTDGLQIEVETFRGVVQLSGYVDSREESVRAGQIAASIDGVKEVENNLSIISDRRTAGQVVDDGVLLTKVNAALLRNRETSAYAIEVQVRAGVVTLAGFVDSAMQKTRAGEISRGVGGVRAVNNNLRVRQ